MSKRFFAVFALLILSSVGVFAQQQKEFTTDGSADEQITLYGGRTTVTFSPGFRNALSSLQIGLSKIFPGSLRGTKATFPITAGTLDADNLRGEIIHAGGLELRRGNTRVRLQNYVIDTTGTGIVLTGLVSANGNVVGRIPLFDVSLPANGGSIEIVRIPNASLTLRPEAASALNGVFNTTAFVAGFDIGTASIFGIAVLDDNDGDFGAIK